MSELRLMAVHAHPDDESSKGAATTARYADEGARVMVVTLTGGERGDILNPAMDLPEVHGRMAEIRRDEMAKAAEILGVEHHWLGFVDSGLPEGDPLPPLPDGCLGVVPLEEPTEALVRVIRKFRPHVLTTYDENGGYPHPDHIRCHQVSVAAYEAAGDSSAVPRRGGAVERAEAVLHPRLPASAHATDAGRVRQARRGGPLREVAQALGPDHDIFDKRVTTRIECAKYFAQRDDALRAHATQIDPKGDFFRAPIEWQQRLWPTEEFELARSRVRVSLPETDLFAGIESRGMNNAALTILGLMAQDPPRDTGPDFGKASPFGLLVIVLLLIGTFLLVWSMNRHLRKLPKSFDDEGSGPGQADPNPADGPTSRHRRAD